MTSPLSMRLGRRFALIGAAAAAIAAFGASSAFASVSLSPEGPYSNSAPTAVTVSGTPEGPGAEAEFVGVVVCNTEAAPGTRCDIVSATEGLEPIEAYEESEIQILVRRGPWQDWNFTSGSPTPVLGSETACLSESKGGDQCAVFVSYYQLEGKTLKQVDVDVAPIVFQ